MYLPPLQPIVNSEILLHGDVEIHPTASIAPGVILKAATDARIVIGADVCLGMGVVLHAHKGSIEIEAGVALGSGVLIIGSSKIGANACIGTTTTIFNSSVAAMTVINPGSIIGDNSRSLQTDNNAVNNVINNEEKAYQPDEPTIDNQLVAEDLEEAAEISSEITNQESNSNGKEVVQQDNSLTDKVAGNEPAKVEDFDPWKQEEIANVESQVEVAEKDQNTEIASGVAIGKVYIDQLLVTLFPHKNSLDNNGK